MPTDHDLRPLRRRAGLLQASLRLDYRDVLNEPEEATGEQAGWHKVLKGAQVSLAPFAVAVVSER